LRDFRFSDDGGSKYLWNVGKLLPDYTALKPSRQPSSSYHSTLYSTGLVWATDSVVKFNANKPDLPPTASTTVSVRRAGTTIPVPRSGVYREMCQENTGTELRQCHRTGRTVNGLVELSSDW
jgi:hypothetical protein